VNSQLIVKYPFLNAVYAERIDPFLIFVSESLGFVNDQTVYSLLQLGIFFFGLWFLYQRDSPQEPSALPMAGVTLGACLLIAGFDPFLLKIHYFPWLLLGLIYLEEKTSFASVGITLLVTFLWVVAAGNIAFAGLLVAAIFVGLRDRGRAERSSKAVGVVVFLGLIMAAMLCPTFQMPSYPAGIQLGKDTVFASLPSPLFGMGHDVNSVFFDSVREGNRGLLIDLLILSFCLIPSFMMIRRGQLSRAAVITGTFFLVLIPFCEAFFPISWFVHAPFQALRRIVPGLNLIDIPHPLLLIILIITLFSLVKEQTFRSATGSLVLLLFGFGVVQFGSENLPYHGFRKGSLDHFKRLDEAGETAGSLSPAFSPSTYVIEKFGDWVLEEEAAKRRDFYYLKRLLPGEDFEWNVIAIENASNRKLAIDHNNMTRWSAARPQKAGDWFEIAFDRKISLLRIILSTHKFPSDYPRGILVESIDENGKSQELVRYDSWEGPVNWTKEGYPYFDSRSRVFIDLPKPITTSRLKFTQLQDTARFDWSIAEIKLYGSK
jgi:hypothetical protein